MISYKYLCVKPNVRTSKATLQSKYSGLLRLLRIHIRLFCYIHGSHRTWMVPWNSHCNMFQHKTCSWCPILFLLNQLPCLYLCFQEWLCRCYRKNRNFKNFNLSQCCQQWLRYLRPAKIEKSKEAGWKFGKNLKLQRCSVHFQPHINILFLIFFISF